MAESSKVPAWEVTGQAETTDIGPAGTFVPGVKVSFRTASGAVGSVFLPRDAFSPARVRDAIVAQAAVLDAVAGMKG